MSNNDEVIDFDQVETRMPTEINPGTYWAWIDKGSKTRSTGGHSAMVIRLNICENKGDDKTIGVLSDTLVHTANAAWREKQLLLSAGWPQGESMGKLTRDGILSHVVDRWVRVRVKKREYDGDSYPAIARYLPPANTAVEAQQT